MKQTRLHEHHTKLGATFEEVDTFNRARALGVTKIVSRNEFSARLKDLVEEMISGQHSAISSQLNPIADR